MSRIYLLEFFIVELNLCDQVIRDAGDAVFEVRTSFVDLPSFEITRQNVSSARVDPPREKSRLDFGAGFACHFTIPPDKFLEKILRHPLSIKVFRKGDSFPVCLAEIPLSGCLCDQRVKAADFPLPKPYVFGGKIGLVDVGGNPSGSVEATLRITTRGKFAIASYVLRDNRLLFKNDSCDGTEFELNRERKEGEIEEDGRDDLEIGTKMEDASEEILWENYVSDIASIFPSAGSISLKKETRKSARVPLAEIYAQDKLEDSTIVVKKEKNKTKMKTKKEKTKKKK